MTELILSNVNGCPSGGKETKKRNQFFLVVYVRTVSYKLLFSFGTFDYSGDKHTN